MTAVIRLAVLVCTALTTMLPSQSRADDLELRAPAIESAYTRDALELGRRMYMQGVLPSGEMISATIRGDIRVSGDQAICGTCHRRSALGSSEGQEVVPPIRGSILRQPFRLPTSKPPLAPELRPAYTDATLRRAIREGIGANGEEFSSFMPRYALSDEQLDMLLGYLDTLTTEPDPGVSDEEIHFSTIVTDSVPEATRKAMLDTMRVYFEQKNTETRNESSRAAHAPWHMAWLYQPYRKWVLHVWELQGSRETWPAQLEARYRQQPVFSVLGGIAPGSWKPVHEFCENYEIPCLFPTTDLPVHNEQDFYTVYLSGGMRMEGETVAQHLSDDNFLGTPVVQVYRDGDEPGVVAAAALRAALEERGRQIKDVVLADGESLDAVREAVLEERRAAVLVLWLGESDLKALWTYIDSENGLARVYVSTTLFADKHDSVPLAARDRLYFVHPQELPGKRPALLARSTGWLRIKRIYAPEAERVQANAYLVMKMTRGALMGIHGYFDRDYFLERIEHMVDNATYTSVYPRLSLAPSQRFVAKGCYIAKLSGEGGGLIAVSEWLVPGSR